MDRRGSHRRNLKPLQTSLDAHGQVDWSAFAVEGPCIRAQELAARGAEAS